MSRDQLIPSFSPSHDYSKVLRSEYVYARQPSPDNDSTNKGGVRRPEKSRKFESFFNNVFLCAFHDVWLTVFLFLSFNLSL